MSRLHNIWNSISYNGIHDDMDRELKRHVILVNQLAVTWIPVVFAYTSMMLLLGQPVMGMTIFSLTIVHLLVLLANRLRLFDLSRLMEALLPSLVIYLVACMAYNPDREGWHASLYVVIMSFFIFTFIFFSFKEKLYSVFCIIVIVVILFAYPWMNKLLYLGEEYSMYYTQWYEYINFCVAALVFIVGLLYMKRINNQYLEEIERLLYVTQEKNTEILMQKEEIETQRDSVEHMNKKLGEQNSFIAEKNEELNQQNEEITAQRDEIERQRNILESQNNEINDSISYACQIQNAFMTEESFFEEFFSGHFIYYKPRNVVSGDFYWGAGIGKWMLFAVADCTGHGIPGALMSMMGISFLNEIVKRTDISRSDHVLNELRNNVIRSLKQKDIDEGPWDPYSVKDGMDIAFCAIDTENQQLQYSGANNSLYLIRKRGLPVVKDILGEGTVTTVSDAENTLYELKPDSMPISIHLKMRDFGRQVIQLEKDDVIYLFSDGFTDQFGGPEGKKFKNKAFKELLLSIQVKDLKHQKEALERYHLDWKNWHETPGKVYEQIDDIVILGLKV